MLAPLSARFQSLPLLPTIKLGPSGADSRVGGLVHALGPCGSLQRLSYEAGSFSCCCLNPHRCFQSEVGGFISPSWSPGLGCLFCSPEFLPVYLCVNVGPGVCQLQPGLPHSTILHLTGSASRSLTVSPLRPSRPSLPLLLVWMNVSSLSPWLSDFYTVQFSVGSGCFCF